MDGEGELRPPRSGVRAGAEDQQTEYVPDGAVRVPMLMVSHGCSPRATGRYQPG